MLNTKLLSPAFPAHVKIQSPRSLLRQNWRLGPGLGVFLQMLTSSSLREIALAMGHLGSNLALLSLLLF